jgi:hypothetical protein
VSGAEHKYGRDMLDFGKTHARSRKLDSDFTKGISAPREQKAHGEADEDMRAHP